MTKEQKKTVLEAIDMFRPQLQADGGDMEFVSIDDENKVHLRLTGILSFVLYQIRSDQSLSRVRLFATP